MRVCAPGGVRAFRSESAVPGPPSCHNKTRKVQNGDVHHAFPTQVRCAAREAEGRRLGGREERLKRSLWVRLAFQIRRKRSPLHGRQRRRKCMRERHAHHRLSLLGAPPAARSHHGNPDSAVEQLSLQAVRGLASTRVSQEGKGRETSTSDTQTKHSVRRPSITSERIRLLAGRREEGLLNPSPHRRTERDREGAGNRRQCSFASSPDAAASDLAQTTPFPWSPIGLCLCFSYYQL